MEFLVVDNRLAYHGALRVLVLKDLPAVTLIHHLMMKFPIPGGVAAIRGNQIEARSCNMNALWKVVSYEALSIMMVDTEMVETEENDEDDETLKSHVRTRKHHRK
ncbi:Uncharacterized protein Adt_27143 [Abeliophyllum distichum]|uniref:Uncharacterized protein n=1 Tax=Abeliophyllum distichum TaxID=126358 RepID=A0ABD1RSW8_9LAMI